MYGIARIPAEQFRKIHKSAYGTFDFKYRPFLVSFIRITH